MVGRHRPTRDIRQALVLAQEAGGDVGDGLESSSVVSAIADDSVTTAVAEGTIAYAADVNPNAISAVAARRGGGVASEDGGVERVERPLAFVKTAAAVSAVIQSPEMRTAIQAASVEGVAGLESTVAASSSTLLADMGDADKLSAAVTEAEASVAVAIPEIAAAAVAAAAVHRAAAAFGDPVERRAGDRARFGLAGIELGGVHRRALRRVGVPCRGAAVLAA